MSDSNTRQPIQTRFPKKMVIWTILAAVAVYLGQHFISEIEDATGHGLDTVTIASLALIAVVWLTWIFWFLFFSKKRVSRRLLGAVCVGVLPVAFFTLFRPVNGGDANIVRFEPIWAGPSDAGDVEVVAEDGGVDLSVESDIDFPRFMGPNQNSIVNSELTFDPAGFADLKPMWKQPIGKGWSGFAARNGFAVTMEQRGDVECVICYDIDSGEVRWLYEHQARHCDAMNLGRTGPRSTPTVHNGDVYAMGAVGNFVCLDGKDGTVKWQKDMNQLLDIKLATTDDGAQTEENSGLAWGRAGSPLIVDDTVVVPGGGQLDQPKVTLMAFECESGELVWKGGDEMIAYGSPTLVTLAGRRQILLTAENKVMGFEPTTGEVLWDFKRAGQTGAAANTSQPTVVSGNQLVTSKGYPDGGGTLIELTVNGDKITPKQVWTDFKVLKTKLTSPVIKDGHSYAMSNGFMECADISNGKRIWKVRGRFGHGQLLLVGDQLLVHTEYGVLHLIAAEPDAYRELATFKTIDGVCWNTLCLYGNKLLVRSELEAACFQLPVK